MISETASTLSMALSIRTLTMVMMQMTRAILIDKEMAGYY